MTASRPRRLAPFLFPAAACLLAAWLSGPASGRAPHLAAPQPARLGPPQDVGGKASPEDAGAQDAGAAGSPEGPEGTAAAVSDAEEKSLIDLADRVEKEVEELRGWHFKTPVAKGVYTEEQLRGFLMKQLDKEWGGGKVERLAAAYRLAGILPPGVPFAKTFVDLLLNQVGGFYDHEKKAFFMLKRQGVTYPEALNRMLVAHELTHALDDQVVDLGAMIEEKDLTSDEEAAIGAVIEGSATVLMTRYSTRLLASGELDLGALMKVQAAEMERGKAFFEAPPVFTTILANYLAGQAFFLAGRGFAGSPPAEKESPGDAPSAGAEPAAGTRAGSGAGGGSGGNPFAGMMEGAIRSVGDLVQRTARDLPRSSEQILHPEKYWSAEDRDDPIVIDDASVEGALEKTGAPPVLFQDTFGELLAAIATREEGWKVSLMAASMSGQAWTHYPAEGWGGDRFYLLGTKAALEAEPSGGNGLRGVWVTVWDTEQDRDEFTAAYTERQGLADSAAVPLGGRTAAFLLGFSEAEAAPLREALAAHPPVLSRNGESEAP